MTTLKTTVPPDVYARAEAKARAEGTTISAVLRAGLLDWLGEPEPVVEKPLAQPTPAQWKVLAEWVGAHPTEWAAYDGPRDPMNPADRAAVYAWYLGVSGNT